MDLNSKNITASVETDSSQRKAVFAGVTADTTYRSNRIRKDVLHTQNSVGAPEQSST